MKKEVDFWELREKINNTKEGRKKERLKKKYKKIMREHGAYIPYNTQFGSRPFLPHGITAVGVSKNAKIGKGCTILHNVSIASNSFDDCKSAGSPTIGDNVFIGVGAIIVGGITIGDNVRIGAGCIIAQDIPPNTTVVMDKPKLISRPEGRDNSYKII